MAFTLQWPNTIHEIVQRLEGDQKRFEGHITPGRTFRERLSFLSPVLNLQADVLYPNAWAALHNIELSGDINLVDETFAVGCKGNQLDNEFPLLPRTPVALPLVQYPSKTRETSTEECDMCALPVLNWETYIKGFRACKYSISGCLRRTDRWRRYNSNRTSVNSEEEHNCADDVPEPSEPQPGTSTAAPQSQLPSKYSTQGSHGSWATRVAYIIKKKYDSRRNKSRNGMTNAEIKKILYHNPVDCGAREVDDLAPKHSEPVVEKKPALDIRLKYQYYGEYKKVPLTVLRKYKQQPDVKVMGTWNHLYAGNGACDWVKVKSSEGQDNFCVLVGSGSKLRVVTLKPAQRDSMLSYAIDSVWEEDEVPTNTRPHSIANDDVLSDVIYRIIARRKSTSFNMAAVQRGRSIEIYSLEGTPTFLTSVSNVCYNTLSYIGGKHVKTRNPMIYSCDINPYTPSEIITLDENNVIRIVDFCESRTVRQIQSSKLNTNFPTRKSKRWEALPKFNLNESPGVAYANHPETFYEWHDSQIYFYDRRARTDETVNFTELLNLRTAVSSISWSDQQYFERNTSVPTKTLNEYVSCVKPSPNSTYYHVGTSERIFLMDMRVPGNPVLKMSHGMRSAATYIDTHKDKSHEVVVAGSQRNPQIYCAIHDHAHVSCEERPDCKARNPILQSFPHHLSNQRDFFNFANQRGRGLTWPCDFERARDHCYAWTTGLCIMPSTQKLNTAIDPGMIVLNSNSFGDIFYQEWDQKSSKKRQTDARSNKLKDFISEWVQAMTAKSFDEFKRPSQNKYFPADCSLLVETSAEVVKRSVVDGEEVTFDPFTPNFLTHRRVRKGLKPFRAQLRNLKSYKGDLVDSLLRPWMRIAEDEEARMAETIENVASGDGGQDNLIVPGLPTVKEEAEHYPEDDEGEVELVEVEFTSTRPADASNGRTQELCTVEEETTDNETCKIDEEEFVYPHEPQQLHNPPELQHLENSESRSTPPVPESSSNFPEEQYYLTHQQISNSQGPVQELFELEFVDSNRYNEYVEEASENAYVIEQNQLAEALATEGQQQQGKIEPTEGLHQSGSGKIEPPEEQEAMESEHFAAAQSEQSTHISPSSATHFQSTTFNMGDESFPITFVVPHPVEIIPVQDIKLALEEDVLPSQPVVDPLSLGDEGMDYNEESS